MARGSLWKVRSRHLTIAATLVAAAVAGGEAEPSTDPGVVNLYSSHHYDSHLALYARFTEDTGIRVNLLEGGGMELIERIATEAEFSPADLLVTVDVGRLWRAERRGVLQPVESPVLNTRVPARLRDPNGHWFGISKRARVIVYNKAAGLPEHINRYEDLADPALRGRVCMRSSSNVYNQSLLASLIEHNGDADALAWARGVVANFQRPPRGNDTAQLYDVAAGRCGVTIANSYYVARILASEKESDLAVADALAVKFPNQADRGTHVNVSGAGVARHAPHRDNAVRFLEFLTSDFAQQVFAAGNNEYPVVGPATGPVAALGEFKEDLLPARVLGGNQVRAVKAFDQAGWK